MGGDLRGARALRGTPGKIEAKGGCPPSEAGEGDGKGGGIDAARQEEAEGTIPVDPATDCSEDEGVEGFFPGDWGLFKVFTLREGKAESSSGAFCIKLPEFSPGQFSYPIS
jgi:hypothetical protein